MIVAQAVKIDVVANSEASDVPAATHHL